MKTAVHRVYAYHDEDYRQHQYQQGSNRICRRGFTVENQVEERISKGNVFKVDEDKPVTWLLNSARTEIS
jgi:hypothetical protein